MRIMKQNFRYASCSTMPPKPIFQPSSDDGLRPAGSKITRSVFDEPNPSPYADNAKRGVDEEVVRRISADKNEPAWMLEHRLKSLQVFREKPMPMWGADLSTLDLDDIIYFAKHGAEETDDWGELPEEIRRVYDRLGIPEAERKVLAGVGAQYESEVV